MDEKRLLFIDIKATTNNSTTTATADEGTQTNQTILGKRLWKPSDNSFAFNFFSESSPAQTEEKPSSYWNPPPNKPSGLTHFPEQDSGFAFNFQIPTVSDACKDMKTDTQSPPALPVTCPPPGEEGCAKDEKPSNAMMTTPTSEPLVSSKGKKKKKSGKKKSPESTDAQQKPTPTEASKDTPLSTEQQLQRELDWCIEQLELGMKTQKSTSKQKEDTSRALKTLRSSKAPLAKKRQVMRSMAGDYRKTMEEEKNKQYKLIQNAITSAQVKAVKDSSKSVFHRRAEIKTESHYTEKSEHEPLQTGDQTPNSSTQLQGEASHFVFTPSKEEFRFNFL